LVLGACGGGAGNHFAAGDMQTVTGDGFTVQMPGKPARETVPIPTGAGTVQASVYTVKNDHEAFLVSASPLPAGARADLKAVLSGGASAVSGNVRDDAATTYQGYPAREGRVPDAQNNGGKGTVFVRVILVAKGGKQVLYHLQYVRKGADATAPALYKQFLASLKIQ
ncbi:MAG: hypothetical protein QOG15_2887, partial [Solirubrobacteraceae bacterium]|nr:hypothetical protein [Solirubrobacteraceae bacterium]